MWDGGTDPEMKIFFQDKLDRISDEQGEKIFIKKDENNRCLFLDADNLCGLQIKLGEDYMPHICKAFPRIEINARLKSYQTASCACPEVVRLLFFDDDSPGQVDKLFQKQPRSEVADKGGSGFVTEDDNLFSLLNEIVTDILSSTRFPAGVRLFYMASLFADIFKQHKQGALKLDQLEKARNATKSNLYEINLALKQGKLEPHPVTAGSYWKVVYELLASRKIHDSFIENADAPLSSFIAKSSDSSEDFEEIYKIIDSYARQSRNDFRGKYQGFIDRYLNVFFASDGFPLAPLSGTHVISIVRCMVGLSLLQLILWMRYASGQPVTDEFMQDLIVEMHRRYMHGNTVIKHLEKDRHMHQIDRYCVCFLDMF